MTQILVAAPFLAFILALLSPALQILLRKALAERPALIFLVPAILSAFFCGIAAAISALSVSRPWRRCSLCWGGLSDSCRHFTRRRARRLSASELSSL